MSRRWKGLLKGAAALFGTVLCVMGLWYVFDFLAGLGVGEHLSTLVGWQILVVVGLTFCLVAANALIAFSWRAILTDLGSAMSATRAQLLFSQANLGKYVPGNVLHMLGRQVLAMREGVPALVVAKSLTLEMLLLVLTSGCIAAVVWFVARSTGGGGGFTLLMVCCAVGGLGLLLQRAGMHGSARAALGYFAYHLIGGVAFALLFLALSVAGDGGTDFWLLVMAYVASWVLGLVTPGAPAGLGVREGVLIMLLQGVPDHAVLGVAVVLSRCMSVLADLAYFGALQVWALVGFRTVGGGRNDEL